MTYLLRITVTLDNANVSLVLEQESQCVDLDLASWRRHTDGGSRAAWRETLDALLDYLQHTGAVDRVCSTARGLARFLDIGDYILALLGVDQIGCAHRLGQLELGGHDVNADDFLHAHGYCGHESCETDATEAENHN